MVRPTRRADVGNKPPQILWTIVRGDTASFIVYVADDARVPLVLSDWSIAMEIKRPNDASNAGIITDLSTTVLNLVPFRNESDPAGEFTVSLSATESALLETGDIFDIQVSTLANDIVWTVAQGSINVIKDVTN